MDHRTIFGGGPLGVIVRLALLSIVVGVLLSALGITPRNFLFHIEVLAHRIYDLGFAIIDWLLLYLALGAIVVVPVWLIARLFGAFGQRETMSSDGQREKTRADGQHEIMSAEKPPAKYTPMQWVGIIIAVMVASAVGKAAVSIMFRL